MSRYNLEFILQVQGTQPEIIKNSIIELGEALEIVDYQDGESLQKHYKICIKTEDPTLVFDVCAQHGRIKSVKVTELEGQWQKY